MTVLSGKQLLCMMCSSFLEIGAVSLIQFLCQLFTICVFLLQLKKSLQRSDRRAGKTKSNCGTGNTESKRVRSNTPTSRHASPSTSENMKGPCYRSNRSHSPKV